MTIASERLRGRIELDFPDPDLSWLTILCSGLTRRCDVHVLCD